MKCLVLAGGFGTRLWPLTRDKPKPLLKIKGEPVITHILNKIPEEIDVTVSINRKFEKDFIEWKKTLKRKVKLFVEEATENKEKLGAVGALNYFIQTKKIKDDLLVIGGDNYFELPLKDFLASCCNKPVIALYEVHEKNKAKEYGVVTLEGRKIVKLEEKPQNPDTTIISTAIYFLPAACFNHLNDFCLTGKPDNLGEFFAYLIQRENVLGWQFDGLWFDIGNFKSYLEAHVKTVKGIIREKGAKIINSSLSGSVFIGEEARIVNSLVKNSIIMNSSVVEDSFIENSIVDAESIVKNSKLSFDLTHRGAFVINGEYKR